VFVIDFPFLESFCVFQELLGRGKKVERFIDTLERRLKRSPIPRKVSTELPPDMLVYRKQDDRDESFLRMQTEKHKTKQKEKQQQQQQQQQQQKTQAQQPQQQNRNLCDCQATDHPLKGNCLNCGRVICTFESFPCVFCGYSNEKGKVVSVPNEKALEEAVRHKNKLVEYDKTAAQRTVVYGKIYRKQMVD
jgi:hypothetical protein